MPHVLAAPSWVSELECGLSCRWSRQFESTLSSEDRFMIERKDVNINVNNKDGDEAVTRLSHGVETHSPSLC